MNNYKNIMKFIIAITLLIIIPLVPLVVSKVQDDELIGHLQIEKIKNEGYHIQTSKLSVAEKLELIVDYENKGNDIITTTQVQDMSNENIQKIHTIVNEQLNILKIDFVSSDANFILIYSEINLFEELLQYGILIRDCANYRGLETGWYRIAVKQRHENEQLLKALKEIIERNRQEADIDGKTDHDTGNDVECREECAGRRSLPHLEGGRL